MTQTDAKIDMAARHLGAAIGDDLYWLGEGKQKHFIDPISIGALSYLLLTIFLKSAAAAAGGAAGKLLWDEGVKLVREILAGRHKPDRETMQKEAEAAQGTLASLSEAARDAAIDSAKDSLHEALSKIAPPAFATSIAQRIGQAARAAVAP